MVSKESNPLKNFKISRVNSLPNTGKKTSKRPSGKTLFRRGVPAKFSRREFQKLSEENIKLQILVEERERALDNVAGNNAKVMSVIAHDLRSPIGANLVALEVLKLTINNCNIKEAGELIDIAIKSSNKTVSLLNSLLSWAVSLNGSYFTEPIVLNLNELVEEEADNFNIQSRQKNIMLECNIAPDLIVKTDKQMVKTVLRNLISNAIKYTPSGGKINISSSENKAFVEITVKDSGIGVSSEIQKNLFKNGSFYSTTGTQNETGQGVGLVLCKEFVDKLGGNIFLESIPGEGTEFKFTLPHY